MFYAAAVFFNSDPRNAMFDGWDGQGVLASSTGLMDIEADSYTQGDVIRLEFFAPGHPAQVGGYVTLWLSVEGTGFAVIPRPKVICTV
jgi:hypothetical protein